MAGGNMKNDSSPPGPFLPGLEITETPLRIVHCKKATFDIYIGRPSPFGNPFVVGKDGTRDEVIDKYEEYVRSNPELMEKIRKEIPGKVLGCWCAPKRCHGEILIKIADEGLALDKNKTIEETAVKTERPLPVPNPEKPEVKKVQVIVDMYGGCIQGVTHDAPGIELDVIFLEDKKYMDRGRDEIMVGDGDSFVYDHHIASETCRNEYVTKIFEEAKEKEAVLEARERQSDGGIAAPTV